MRVLNADTNANHDPATNPEPTLTLSLSLNINLTLTLPIAWLHRYVQPGFLTRGYGMNAVLLLMIDCYVPV